jgi:hypothetical protein
VVLVLLLPVLAMLLAPVFVYVSVEISVLQD